MLPQDLRIVAAASTHQGDILRFQNTAGKQCVANSLAAILCSKVTDITTWSSAQLDNILFAGDRLYRTINLSHDFLEFEDLPSTVSMFGNHWKIDKTGNEDCNVSLDSIYELLQVVLFQGSDIIILIGDASGAYASSLM